MPKTGQILPMNTNKSDQRQVVLLCFDGIQILDVTGPASVFAAANDALGRDFYRVNIISAHGGVVQSNSAIALTTQAIANIDPKTVDICLVSGGSEQGIADFVANLEVQSWISQVHQHSHRIGSICTGAFALAELGLLNGKRVATHWAYCDDFMRRFPKVTVDPNALFIEDGKVWTSAGITTGIDFMKIADAAQDVVRPAMPSECLVDRSAMMMGYAGCYSSFLKHAENHAERYGVPAAEILLEAGARKLVGGQEDQLIDIALELRKKQDANAGV